MANKKAPNIGILPFSCSFHVEAEYLERIGRAGFAASGPIAVLGDGHAGSCDDETDSSRDVERVVSVTPGSAAIDRAFGRVDGNEPLPQRARSAGDLVRCFAARGHIDQEPCDRIVIGFTVEDPAENLFGFRFPKMLLCVGKRFHAGTLAAMPQISRKLASKA